MDRNQLNLGVFPVATHHEYYILCNMSRRYAKVSAQLRRKVVVAGRNDNCLSQIEVRLPFIIGRIIKFIVQPRRTVERRRVDADVRVPFPTYPIHRPLLKNKETLLYDEGVRRDDCFVVEITIKEVRTPARRRS